MAKKDEKRNVKPPTRLAVDISKNGKPQMRYWVFQEALTFDENGVPLTWIPYYKTCNKCGGVFYDRNREEAMSQSGDINENFYQDYDTIDNNFDGHLQTCKNCLFSSCDNNDGIIDQKKLIKALMKYNKVYNHTKFLNVFEKKQSSKNYFSSLSSLAGQREKGFLESDKEAFEILIEMAKEENGKLDFNIKQEYIEHEVQSTQEYNEEIEYDIDNLLPDNKRKKLTKKWGKRDDVDLVYLDNKYKEICEEHNFQDSDIRKNDDDLMMLSILNFEIRNCDASSIKELNENIGKIKQRLGIDRKSDNSSSGLSINEIYAVSERMFGFCEGKKRTKYPLSQDLINKMLLCTTNTTRRSIDNTLEPFDTIDELLAFLPEKFDKEYLDINNHLNEVEINNLNIGFEEELIAKERMYQGNVLEIPEDKGDVVG